jgi:hypothetical protein
MGLSGDLVIFVGKEQLTATAADCLDIKDMGNIATIETDYLKLEDAGPDSDFDSDSATGHYFFIYIFTFYFLDGGLRHM